jgi:hypothetical protein
MKPRQEQTPQHLDHYFNKDHILVLVKSYGGTKPIKNDEQSDYLLLISFLFLL